MPRRSYSRKKRYYKKGYRKGKKVYRKKRYTKRKKTTKTISIWRRVRSVEYAGPSYGYNWGQEGPVSPPEVTSFSFDNIVDAAVIKAMWGQYKPVKAISFFFNTGSSQDVLVDTVAYNVVTGYTVQTNGISWPHVAGYRDPDGTRTAQNWGEMCDKRSSWDKTMMPGRKIGIKWKPFYAQVIGNSGFKPTHNWLSTDYGQVPFYGLVWDWSNPSTNKNYSGLTIMHELWVKFAFKDLYSGRVHMAPPQ